MQVCECLPAIMLSGTVRMQRLLALRQVCALLCLSLCFKAVRCAQNATRDSAQVCAVGVYALQLLLQSLCQCRLHTSVSAIRL